MDGTAPRKYPMRKPDGHVPPIPRFTARLPKADSTVNVVFLGIQSRSGDEQACLDALRDIDSLLKSDTGPEHHDFAKFTDHHGCPTAFVTAYWRDTSSYDNWCQSEPVRRWWLDPRKENGPLGFFRESMSIYSDYAETNIFREYVRGLSACPMTKIEPVDETGYWGAARDRFPASAYDLFESALPAKLDLQADRHGSVRRVNIRPPKNFVMIRSGVTWADCGEEQLQSFQTNIRPKLDNGMKYLRENPIDTGCCALRQSEVISVAGDVAQEEFSVGYFRSLQDLEAWAHEHPTHLAIFTRAIAEREKYGDKLELRTYHEIYVLAAEGSLFEYVNCHENTGLLPFFDSERGG